MLRRSLSLRFILPAGLAVLVILGVAATLMIRQQQASALADVRAQAKQVTDELFKVRSYINGRYVTPTLKSGTARGLALPVPAKALIDISREMAGDGYYDARLISTTPLDLKNAPTDAFERDGLARVAQGVASVEGFGSVGGRLYYRRLVPDIATSASCIGCHAGKEVGQALGGLVVSIPYDAKARALSASAWTLGGMAAGLIAVIVGLIWFLIRRTVAQPLSAAAETSQRVAAGDLTVTELPVRGSDEIGRVADAFNTMVRRLREVIDGISDSSRQVAAASEELAATADEVTAATRQVSATVQGVARGATEQTSGAQATVAIVGRLGEAVERISRGAEAQSDGVRAASSVIERMTAAIGRVAGMAQEVSEAAARSLAVAEEGGAAVDETVAGMGRIKETALAAAARVKELGERSRQIGEIVELIGDIAGQTNLLALNAAIEAARVGEHGKGFAVVAEEVRRLAERAADASKTIAELVQGIRGDVEAAVAAMDAGTREVEVGAEVADGTGRALRSILEAMRQTNACSQDISAAAAEVAAGTDEVVKAVRRVADITAANATTTGEMAASGAAMTRGVEGLAAISQETAEAVGSVSATTEQVNASAEGVSGAARNLADMAQRLQGLVALFRV